MRFQGLPGPEGPANVIHAWNPMDGQAPVPTGAQDAAGSTERPGQPPTATLQAPTEQSGSQSSRSRKPHVTTNTEVCDGHWRLCNKSQSSTANTRHDGLGREISLDRPAGVSGWGPQPRLTLRVAVERELGLSGAFILLCFTSWFWIENSLFFIF